MTNGLVVACGTLEALGNLADDAPLRVGATALLDELGYSSQRTAEVGSVQEFLERFAHSNKLTKKQRKLFESWTAVEIVFQFTAGEIVRQSDLFETHGFDQGRIESFLFLAVDMARDAYSRTHLAETTRAVNRLFAMPVILLFRHGSTLTLATTHRRVHTRDDSRDVLDRVTLVKDIRLAEPHRAHIEILSDLAFSRMRESGVRSFDELHEEWERVLDIETLNKRFYRKLFAWFERAVAECRFPDDGAGEEGTERHVIRLITRLLFIWFMKEKGLVPDTLFDEEFSRATLKRHTSNRTDYYRAVLQNLFFATLNTEIDKRGFSNQTSSSHRDFTKYRYHDLLTDPDAFARNLEKVPFVNGGLFDCLDDFTVADGGLVDAFTEDLIKDEELCVPARLLLDQEGLFTLFRHFKFTVEESTPLDREVALDPELLGRVFENLLAAYNPETRATARNATGSYYTPRPVVDYMVGEALVDALAGNAQPTIRGDEFWRERLRYLLNWEDAKADAGDFFEPEEKESLVGAIAGLRVLDPAVGSGAFPMGILQTLTLVLRRLDPDNALWEQIQKKRAKARAGATFDTHDQAARSEALREISDTFEKYRQSDFGRKLYLIQNAIYGVDIQPIACQIAKLRFFISLVIEQDPDLGAPNLGIKPLPNLETRLVAADSLLSFKAETGDLLHHNAVASKQREVAAVRDRYFLADSRPKKLECMQAEKRLRDELQDILETERRIWVTVQDRDIESMAARFPNADTRETFRAKELGKLALRQREYDETLAAARLIAEWDPYDQNAHAGWFDPEYMFDVSAGFDVVIGNPPYIQLQKDGGRARKKYQNAGYETFASTGDIYQLFYERGCGLLKPRAGVLAYITSNSWLKAEYGKPLRQWFAERHMPLQLIEMGKNVFENAIVDTAVLIVRNGTGHPVTCPAVDVDQASENRFPPPKGDWGTLQPEGDRPWMALSSVERSVMEKMETVGTPLREWDISIYRGILTGYNDAFIIDTAVRDRLIAEDPSSEEILKPILRGRDIARYRANWADLWLISTFPSLGLDIDAYPAIKRHLLSFGKGRLSQEGRQLPGGGRSRKKTSNAWYELQDTCSYHGTFASEKVIWIELVDRGRFAYDESGMFIEATTFMITGERMNYLCAFLNSRLAHWYILKTAPTSGMGVPRWKKVYVESIPVAILRPSAADTLCRLVDEARSVTSSDEKQLAQIEKRINEVIYETYGISAEEVEVIELATNH